MRKFNITKAKCVAKWKCQKFWGIHIEKVLFRTIRYYFPCYFVEDCVELYVTNNWMNVLFLDIISKKYVRSATYLYLWGFITKVAITKRTTLPCFANISLLILGIITKCLPLTWGCSILNDPSRIRWFLPLSSFNR